MCYTHILNKSWETKHRQKKKHALFAKEKEKEKKKKRKQKKKTSYVQNQKDRKKERISRPI